MRRVATLFLCMGIMLFTVMQNGMTVYAVIPEPDITAPSFVLMEETTGEVICERAADERRSPASITKIMTLILIFDALESGKITLEEEVMTSAYAKSMGGSQVFLEEGEMQTVDTMMKCICVASGNDASVAMAEHICGSEEAFVEKMNEKAAALGLENTHFLDCTGLSDSKEHYSSAGDVAIMSRHLISKYPAIYDYTSVWMEDIVHKTSRGESVFTLANTNKLLKQYPYTTGLKTGSTDQAKYCISATAKKDDMSLIAVVMGAETPALRFAEAKELLHYGFGVASFYRDEVSLSVQELPVSGALKKSVSIRPEGEFVYLDTYGIDSEKVEISEILPEKLEAPVAGNSQVGEVIYRYEGSELGRVKVLADEAVPEATFTDCFLFLFREMLL